MPKSQKKSTKRFEKKHLKDTLERRKDFAKTKQRHQQKEKKKARRAKENVAHGDHEEKATKRTQKQEADAKAADIFKNMTVDEFFQGGFDIAEPKKTAKVVIGKRKREAKNEEQESEESFENDRVESDSDAGSESEFEGEEHKGDLEALAKTDPKFYKYLQENDAELLDFDENGDLAGLSDDEEPPKKKEKKGKVREDEEAEDGATVSLAMIRKWKKSMQTQQSLRAMREVVLAFRAAARANEDSAKGYKYTISSSDVYHQLLMTALNHVAEVVQHHLPIKESASGKVKVPTDSKKFKSMAPILMSYSTSITHLLETLSDTSTLKLTLSSINPLLPYILSFKKVVKTLAKVVVEIWSDSSNDEATRVNAFLLVRRLAVIGDASIREALLKSTYQGLIKGSRNTTVHTISGINLMKNSAVDLWGCDYALGYTTGFTYIRQLAIHLRTTMTKPTKDSYKVIYNWQYVHSLDFWSRVLSAHCSPAANPLLKKPTDSPLHPLIYPLVQVTLGALRLIPTPTYFPLRFHLIRSLLRISRSTNTYIPLAPALVEVLQSPEVKDVPKPSTLKPLDFNNSIRAPKQYSRTRAYQDGIMEQVSELFAEFFGVWAKNVAFPELIIPPTVLMKRWMKEASSAVPQRAQGKHNKMKHGRRNTKLTSSLSILIQKMNLNAEFIQKHRRKLEFAPKDREQLDNFLKDLPWEDTPLGAYVAGMRQRNEEQEKLLEKSRREEEARRRKEKEKEIDADEEVIEDMEEDASDKSNYEGESIGSEFDEDM